MRLSFISDDPVVTLEFALVCAATLSFIGGVYAYFVTYSIPAWNLILFTACILLKHWLEFFESVKDRRIHQIPESELPFTLRRLTD